MNNPVESINRQSTSDNVKSVPLKPLLEHFYLKDCWQVASQIAAEARVTISSLLGDREMPIAVISYTLNMDML